MEQLCLFLKYLGHHATTFNYCVSPSGLTNLRTTNTKIITAHVIPKTTSTILAMFVMSKSAIASANDEPPRLNGDPGIILGVGLGVGKGVGEGVGVIVGIGVGV
jgi:isopentenyl diphosphate isomerase/L-lactate dehydrogenase-like FMN-dependent dehydrogenase